MPVRLKYEGGKCAVYTIPTLTSTDDGPLTSPLTAANVGRVIWHSDLEYFEVVQDQTVTITFPARSSLTSTPGINYYFDGNAVLFNGTPVDHTPFTALSLSTVPFGALLIGGVLSNLRASGSGLARRFISPVMSTSGMIIRERFSAGVAAETLTMRALVFAPRVPDPALKDLKIDIQGGRIQLGRGMIDTNTTKGFLRQVTSGGINFSVDRTIDTVSGGLKRWNLDGTTTTIGVYTGSYAGPTLRQVST